MIDVSGTAERRGSPSGRLDLAREVDLVAMDDAGRPFLSPFDRTAIDWDRYGSGGAALARLNRSTE